MSITDDIAAAIHDNTAGEITPEVLRNILLEMVGSLGQGSVGPQGVRGAPGQDADIQSILNTNHKILAQYLPPSSAAPHHIFATQADMLAGSRIVEGDLVLVHGDPSADNNGEYMALQDDPTTLAHYDHLGEHTRSHRHDGVDIDVNVPFAAGSIHLQNYLDEPYAPVNLQDTALSAGDLRHMTIGRTYNFPTEDFPSYPGSTSMIPAAKTQIIGVPKTNHHYVNACIIRTGVHTWIAEAEEYTGTNRQPTIIWALDLDPAWSDHSGIGDIGARSFTSVTTTIVDEIGDATQLGADTLVGRLIHEENERHTLSTRIATLEGGTAHQHVDIVQDFKLQVNNQGLHYCIVNDRPTNPDHIGKDLYDGNEHKVALEWDTGFNPTKVIDNADTADWLTGPKPNVWLQQGTAFKQLVDPLSNAVLGFTAIKSFVDNGSILTVKWDLVNLRLEVNKVQAPSVHVVTNPDHQPIQVGGQVDAKSVPFVSLNTAQQAAVKNNSLWVDETQRLMWRNNAGVDSQVLFGSKTVSTS